MMEAGKETHPSNYYYYNPNEPTTSSSSESSSASSSEEPVDAQSQDKENGEVKDNDTEEANEEAEEEAAEDEDDEEIDWNEEMLLCARYGEEDDLKALLQPSSANRAELQALPSIDVNHQDPFSKATALHYASANGHCSIVKFLTNECKARADLENYAGNTCLIWAVQLGELGSVEALCEAPKECNVNVLQKNPTTGKAALNEAFNRNHEKIIKLLLEHWSADELDKEYSSEGKEAQTNEGSSKNELGNEVIFEGDFEDFENEENLEEHLEEFPDDGTDKEISQLRGGTEQEVPNKENGGGDDQSRNQELPNEFLTSSTDSQDRSHSHASKGTRDASDQQGSTATSNPTTTATTTATTTTAAATKSSNVHRNTLPIAFPISNSNSSSGKGSSKGPTVYAQEIGGLEEEAEGRGGSQKSELTSESASKELELSGAYLWGASIILSRWIVDLFIATPQLFHNKNVVELGAGCGLPAITAFRYTTVASVLVTDLRSKTWENTLENVLMNVKAYKASMKKKRAKEKKKKEKEKEKNHSSQKAHQDEQQGTHEKPTELPQPQISCHALDWKDESTWPKSWKGTTDVIIGADLAYEKELVAPLLDTILSLFPKDKAGTYTFLYASPVARGGLKHLIAAMKAAGFSCSEMTPPDSYLENPLQSVSRRTKGDTKSSEATSNDGTSEAPGNEADEGTKVDDSSSAFSNVASVMLGSNLVDVEQRLYKFEKEVR